MKPTRKWDAGNPSLVQSVNTVTWLWAVTTSSVRLQNRFLFTDPEAKINLTVVLYKVKVYYYEIKAACLWRSVPRFFRAVNAHSEQEKRHRSMNERVPTRGERLAQLGARATCARVRATQTLLLNAAAQACCHAGAVSTKPKEQRAEEQ